MLEVWAQRANRPPLRPDSQLDATVTYLINALMQDGARPSMARRWWPS